MDVERLESVARRIGGLIVADGDLDGVFGARLLKIWASRVRGDVEVLFPDPREVRSMELRECLTVEISRERVRSASDVLTFDHHPVGYVEHVGPDGSLRWRFELGQFPSVSRMIKSLLNVKDESTRPYMEFVDLVDSDPMRIVEDPRYVGYRLMLEVQDWKIWVVEGEAHKAFQLFEEVGGAAVDRWLSSMRSKVVFREVDGIRVAFIPVDGDHKEVVHGYEISIERALSRILQLELEESSDYSIIVKMEGGRPRSVSIASPSRRNADVIARALGGGGHPQVAGAPMDVENLEEAISRILREIERVNS